MDSNAPTALWIRPRPASKMLGMAYSTVLRLAAEGAIPSKSYLAGKKKRYLIALSWILKGGEAK